MSKSPEQLTPRESRGEKNQRFESLVESLVKGSSLFPEKQITPDEKLDIVKAIENNEITLYLGNHAGDRILDAVHCLTAIYDELGKDEPDEDFLNQTVEQLKEYL